MFIRWMSGLNSNSKKIKIKICSRDRSIFSKIASRKGCKIYISRLLNSSTWHFESLRLELQRQYIYNGGCFFVRGRRIEFPSSQFHVRPARGLHRCIDILLFSSLSFNIPRKSRGGTRGQVVAMRVQRDEAATRRCAGSSVIYIQKSRAHKYCIFCKAHVRHTQIVISEFAASSPKIRATDIGAKRPIWRASPLFPFSRSLLFPTFQSVNERLALSFLTTPGEDAFF